MKEQIPYLTMARVKALLAQPTEVIEAQIQAERDNLPTYVEMIGQGAQSRDFAAAVAETQDRVNCDRQANPNGATARTAGAYFANENVIAGSMVPTGVEITNRFGGALVPGWEDRGYKIKLGPGITFVRPAQLYTQLLEQGVKNPELAVNYTAPFGTAPTRQGLADILNGRFDDEVAAYFNQQVIQTSGCTEAIELALEAIGQVRPGSEVLSVGFSYYTALFTAEQKGLCVQRVMPSELSDNSATRFQPTAAEIAARITPETSALLLTIPNNPTGEMYPAEELRAILQLAAANNLYILFDAIFEEMVFTGNEGESTLLNLAQELGVLDRVIVVDSLAKRRGLAGARLGWLAAQDQAILNALEMTILARRCNPPLIYEPIAQLEGVFSLLAREQRLMGEAGVPALAQQLITERRLNLPVAELLQLYGEWDDWRRTSQEYYQQNLDVMRLTLDGFATGGSTDQAAFNSFVRLGEGISSTDFMTKLMLLTGTYTQVGPCFGIAENIWRDQLGLWARVSYATDREDLIAGLTRMIALAMAYQELNLGDNTRYPALGISYDRQV